VNRSERMTWCLVALAAGVMAAALPMAAQDDPPGRVARIDRLQGDVSLMYPNSQWWTEAPPNYPLYSGARIYTADFPSQVEIQSGGTEIRGWSDTDITLTSLVDGYEQVALASGSVRVSIFSLNPGDLVEIDTPNGAVLLEQPGSYRVDAFPDSGASDLAVSAGLAVVAAPGGLNQEVDQGQAVQLIGSNPTDLEPVGFPDPDGLDNWSSNLDAAYRNSMSLRYVSPYMVGYGDLDANGTWAQEPQYGPVWFPKVGPGWRPYSAGHWAYVAPWGYTWIDDAPWGYAPFHYGRWVTISGLWAWVPGPREVRPVYSPALVAFVGGPGFSIGVGVGGGGVAAWFPLGVGEPYLPWYHCSPSYARNVNVTNVNISFIHDTTVVNNFNVFVTNTRTVTNVTNITVNNVYVNRTQVVVVPAAAMSSGGSVKQAQITVTPEVQRQLASAPVHAAAAPPAAPPARPQLVAKTSVKAPVAAPTVMTPRGPAKATAPANAAHQAPPPLPKPKPATALAKPAPGTVAGRPPQKPASGAGQPAAAPAQRMATPPPAKPAEAPARPENRPAAPPATKPAPTETKPAPPAASKPAPAAKPAPTEPKPAPAAKPAETKPAPPPAASKPAPAKPEDKKPPQKKKDETKPEDKDKPPS
jgi:hypothetical protein